MSDVKSPIIAFGLYAATCALKAKAGKIGLRDRLSLAAVALEWVPEDADARAAVLDFLGRCEHHPQASGESLLAFLDGWHSELRVRDPEAALAEIARAAPEFDWQSRKDAGL